jgi:hypothetical protein
VSPPRASTIDADSPRSRAWRELANKARVYWLVRASGLSPRVDAETPWEALVERVERLDSFSALFRIERLGHELARAAWKDDSPPSDLFTGPRSRALPERALVMLHAGLGLCIADRTYGRLPRRPDDAAIAGALGEFLRLCRSNTRPGYTSPAFEPMGAVIRLFYPHLLAGLARGFGDRDVEARRCFWHGVGRAIYFLPRHAYPGGSVAALERCRREAEDDESLTETLSGFFFATTMVNLRHPDVLEALLAGGRLRDEDEPIVAGAVAAALLARHHTTPDDPSPLALLHHRPAAERDERWRRRVAGPAERALLQDRQPLVELGLLPRLARHHDLAEIAALTASRAVRAEAGEQTG